MKSELSPPAQKAVVLLHLAAVLECLWIGQVLYLDTLLLELEFSSWDAFQDSVVRESGIPWLFATLLVTFCLYQATEYLHHIMMAKWNVHLYEKMERAGMRNFKYGPVMAMVGWLIPVVSILVPLWVMDELHGRLLAERSRPLAGWWLMEFLPAFFSVGAFIAGLASGLPWLAFGIYLAGRGVYFYHFAESTQIIRRMDAASQLLQTEKPAVR